MIFTKIFIFFSLFVSCVALFHGLQRKNVVKNIYTQITETVDDAVLERIREERRNIMRPKEPEGLLEKLLAKPRKSFVYSRMGNLIPGLTVEWWLLLNLVIAALMYFVVLMVGKSMIFSFVAPAAYIAAVYVLQKIMMYRNYRAVERQLLHFVNLMENFRMSAGEVTGIFHKVSKHLQEPLRSVLDECYYEAQTSGDVSAALYSLADKIEHPKFKDFIHNTEACVRYTANFKSVVESGRNDILREQGARIDRKRIVGSAVTMTGLCIGSGFGLWAMMGQIVGIPLPELFTSPLGTVALVIIAIILIMFAFSVTKAVR